MMSDSEQTESSELLAIPRLAERVGVTPRVLRYWEEQGLISPTREHGKLRYSPRDVAIARLIRRLLDAGAGIERCPDAQAPGRAWHPAQFKRWR